jgi:hypothetical protein
MTDAAVPLATLEQRIEQQEAELQALRQEYEARQARLAALTQTREDLAAQLRAVDAEIEAVFRGNAVPVPAPAASRARPGKAPTLPETLLDILRQAGRPLTVKELADEIVRRRYPTRSGNVHGMVQTRVREMVARGVLRRAPANRPGFEAAGPAARASAAAKSRPAEPAPRTAPAGRPSLRDLLTRLLRRARRPLKAQELAEQALKAGHQTSSKSFVDVVGVALSRMDNLERVPGRGYRLRKE